MGLSKETAVEANTQALAYELSQLLFDGDGEQDRFRNKKIENVLQRLDLFYALFFPPSVYSRLL